MLLSFSIGTFLTNYEVTNRQLYSSQHTPLYKNEQNEREIIQWWLIMPPGFGKKVQLNYQATRIGVAEFSELNFFKTQNCFLETGGRSNNLSLWANFITPEKCKSS